MKEKTKQFIRSLFVVVNRVGIGGGLAGTGIVLLSCALTAAHYWLLQGETHIAITLMNHVIFSLGLYVVGIAGYVATKFGEVKKK